MLFKPIVFQLDGLVLTPVKSSAKLFIDSLRMGVEVYAAAATGCHFLFKLEPLYNKAGEAQPGGIFCDEK